jgi:archaellum component FlaG (FlaF/FlaG flagellin family)
MSAFARFSRSGLCAVVVAGALGVAATDVAAQTNQASKPALLENARHSARIVNRPGQKVVWG